LVAVGGPGAAGGGHFSVFAANRAGFFDKGFNKGAMHVQDLKRWHWVVLALGIGLALSWVWSSVEWDENVSTIGQRDFEAGLTIPYPKAGHLETVTVMPPLEGKYKVVAEQMRNTKTPGVMDLHPVAYMADAPYKAGQWRGEGDEYKNVREYLATLKRDNPDMGVSYRYAWWRETWAIYVLWTGACLLLIGGVWPSVISLMVGAGLGFNAEEKGPEYDLDRFKGEPDKAKAAKPQPTAADVEHLHQLEEELEKKLKARELGLPVPEDEPVAGGGPAPVRTLDGGPLQVATLEKPAEDHEYKGEFYPVDRGAKKKHE